MKRPHQPFVVEHKRRNRSVSKPSTDRTDAVPGDTVTRPDTAVPLPTNTSATATPKPAGQAGTASKRLSLKGMAPAAPPANVAGPAKPKAAPKVEAPKSADEAPKAGKPKKGAPKPQALAKPRGPINPSQGALNIAREIDNMLTQPAPVLPQSADDIIRPFQVGLGKELEARLRPEETIEGLQKSIRQFVGIGGYLLACAQPGAMRHDVNGQPVEPVSEEDRLHALDRFRAVMKRRRERNAQAQAEAEAAEAAKTEGASADKESGPGV